MALRPTHLVTAALISIAAGATAFAQSTYVSAALVGDVFRTTHSESPRGDTSSGGEALGFALRVGTPLGNIWGVELDFTRPGEIESDFTSGPIPLVTSGDLIAASTVPGGLALPQIFPPISYRFVTTQRHTTMSASVWVHQYLTPRFSLVYLGGMGFHRTTYESETRFDILAADIARPLVLPTRTKTILYGVRPLAGFEAHIGLTEHVELVPGFRLHGVEGGWLMRPAVALGWMF